MEHHFEVKVYGYHCDLYGHVNNAKYLEFIEAARWEYFDTSGEMPLLQQLQLAPVAVNINISYKREAKFGQRLHVTTIMSALSQQSFVLTQTITLSGTDTVISEAQTTLVCVSVKTGEVTPLDGELLEKVQKLLHK